MRVLLSWLAEYVEIRERPEALAERLTQLGFEVEGIEVVGAIRGGRVVEVADVRPHPAADRLWVVDVVWPGGEARVVTGAANVRPGLRVPWAEPGCVLPGERALERRSVRGVASEGMLLSAAELGLGPEADGILELPEDAPVGAPLAEALGLPDTVLEVSFTPNVAPFAQSMVGLALELAAAGLELRPLPEEEPPAGDVGLEVQVEEERLCPRYALGAVEEVRAGTSPLWLRRRLWAAGLRSRLPVVDVTNYVLVELGQPLHAFDRERLEGGLFVRRARGGEAIVTLDGQERALGPEDLVIADRRRPVAIAGVMGALEAQVHAGTRRVVIEAAAFDPSAVRRTARRLGLATEAAARFERGVNIDGVRAALGRALSLCAALGAGRPLPAVQDLYPRPVPHRRLVVPAAAVAGRLGVALGAEEVAGYLARLRLSARAEGENVVVDIPPRRSDIQGPADLAEEVGRLYGLDRIEAVLPEGALTVGGAPPAQELVARLRRLCLGAGFHEGLTYSLIGRQDVANIRWPGPVVPVVNPLREEGSCLRPSLLPGLLRALVWNRSRGRAGVRLFDVGRVFWPQAEGEAPEERLAVGILGQGSDRPGDWRAGGLPLDFFAAKGTLLGLLERLGFADVDLAPGDLPYLHPGRQARALRAGRAVGACGEVHPAVLRAYDLDEVRQVMYVELDLTALLTGPPAPERPAAGALDRFPAAERDVAVVLPNEVRYAEAEAAVRAAGGELLEDVRLFDVYQGPQVPPGHRSLAFRLTLRAPDRTLVEAEIEDAVARVQRALAGLGGRLRA